MVHKSKDKIVTKKWWALVQGPRDLPVLFDSYHDARQNMDDDEYLVRVKVSACK